MMHTSPKMWMVHGDTGSGKTSFVNKLAGKELGIVGGDMWSCTENVSQYKIDRLKAIIVDGPGTQDTGKTRDQIRAISSEYLNSLCKESQQGRLFDTIFLLVKCDPRMNSITYDIEELNFMYGPDSFKAVVIVLIFGNDGPNSAIPSNDEIIKDLSKMTSLCNVMESAGRGAPSADWFVVWSNLHPRPEQESELIAKASKTTPYTCEMIRLSKQNAINKLKADHEEDLRRYEEYYSNKLSNDEEKNRIVKKEFKEAIDKLAKEHKTDIEEICKRDEDRMRLMENYKLLGKVVDCAASVANKMVDIYGNVKDLNQKK